MVTLHLPYPPPLSACYTNNPRRGRVKTRRYRKWAADATWSAVGAPQTSGPIAVTITAGRPDRRRRDLDNLFKPTLDFLTDRKLIEDDSLIEDLRIKWGVGEGLKVEIEPLRGRVAA